jgi:para-nitrobenzyl esterase
MKSDTPSMPRLTTMRLTVLLALAAMTACASRGETAIANTTAGDVSSDTYVASPSLAGTSWRMLRFEGGDDRVLTATDPAQYTMTFTPDGQVSVRIACNRGQGTWTSPATGQLALGPVALTRAMCPPDPLQDRWIKDWPAVRSYVLKNGHLYLSLMADGGIYEFEPLP